jgi:hypothetical protein
MTYETHVNFSFIDYGGETSTMQCAGVALTAANFDATIALWEALESALVGANGITLGNLTKTAIAHTEPTGLLEPASPLAQRETKWLVHYHVVSTGNKYTLEIPNADITLLDPNARDRMLIASGDGAAFVSAFEDVVKSPDDLQPVVVDYILHVGRNT